MVMGIATGTCSSQGPSHDLPRFPFLQIPISQICPPIDSSSLNTAPVPLSVLPVMSDSYLSLLTDPNPDYVRAAWIMLVVWVLRGIVFPSMVSAMLVRMTISLSHSYDVLAR